MALLSWHKKAPERKGVALGLVLVLGNERTYTKSFCLTPQLSAIDSRDFASSGFAETNLISSRVCFGLR